MTASKIRVVIVDDHQIVREGIKQLLDNDTRFLVLSEADSVKTGIDEITKHNPDIALVDMKLPDGDGIEIIHEVKKTNSYVKFIILTAYNDQVGLIKVFEDRINGYLLKTVNSSKIIHAIINVHNGQRVLIDDSDKRNPNAKGKSSKLSLLNEQEYKILSLVSLGKTNKEIAATLFISEKTVRNYITSLFHKLNLTNRTEAALYFINSEK